ncbi:hypothetical protein QNH46_21190 [Paenibacillus woosongensis]|uniref:Uncharacterized protein n=1 Tax=Paenibacillus woosongensis TaxID=307580 RepID=A0AA95I6Y5_9BACL|nr:hypothetical protein [Paenibacillus woosongensis]WHX48553.1 hypothetical protein QNH46_21190 [Paenibacillus woosongensis]
MQDYSLDVAAERIKHPKTKEYFQEVMSSYAIGNYRSAVLSLYAIVISDLVFKLKDQVERESDPGAEKILKEVEQEKKKDITSSKWEKLLVEKVFQETKLLELSDKANIEYLKDHRNLSAHPNILDTEDNVLFTPNKETVRAHIRNMLEGVLTKSSTHTAKLVDLIITKLPQMYELANDTTEFERMLVKRYLGEMNGKALTSLFKKLWKFTYRLDDDDCDENREVNAITVELINRIYPDLVIKCLSDDPVYYSQVSFGKKQINKLIDLFNQSPRLFILLDEDVQKQLDTEIRRYNSLFVRAWFLSSDPEEHLNKVVPHLSSREFNYITLNRLEELARTVNKMNVYRKMLIKYLSSANNYSGAIRRIEIVKRKLEEFEEDELNELLKVMNSNSQIYNAYGCGDLVNDIQETAENNFGIRIDLSPYSNLS